MPSVRSFPLPTHSPLLSGMMVTPTSHTIDKAAQAVKEIFSHLSETFGKIWEKVRPIFEHIPAALGGWSEGYAFAVANTRENEIKQGKNYYMASLLQGVQFLQLGAVISHVASRVLVNALPAKILCNVVPLASFPLCFLMAHVKHGHHGKLNAQAIKVIHFFAEHTGDILRVAMIAASVTAIALGSYVFGGCCLAAIAYQAIDHLGVVPMKVSLFMETYMPVVTSVGLLLCGTVVVQMLAACTLATQLSSSLNRWVHQRVDLVVHKFFQNKLPKNMPTLKELDAPLVERKEMTYDEIKKILDTDEGYEINPAHYSKWATDLSNIPEDSQFDKFLKLFDTIKWEVKYELLKKKLLDDERFMDFLQDQYPTESKEQLKNHADQRLEALARQKNITKEQYAADWVRTQIAGLVAVLKGKKRVKGSQKDLADARPDCAKVLAHLQHLKGVEFEDVLLKLAIEGGDYCARGIKRAAGELALGLLQQYCPELSDPHRQFEGKIRAALQQQRLNTVQAFYEEIVKLFPKKVGEFKSEVHLFDLYRKALCLGFTPLTPRERQDVGLMDIVAWEFYSKVRSKLYKCYDPFQAFEEVSNVSFWGYMRRAINDNPKLTETQKEDLIEKMADYDENPEPKFRRLMLVMLGILREKRN